MNSFVRSCVRINRQGSPSERSTTMRMTRQAAVAAVLAFVALVAGQGASATSLVWSKTDGNWDTGSLNWNDDKAAFTDGGVDDVTFNNTAGGAITISANMTPTSTTVSASSGTYRFIGGAIDGGTLVKSGAGTLDLRDMLSATGTNGFSSITLSGGKVQVDRNANSAKQLGSGPISVIEDSTISYAEAVANDGTALSNPTTIASGKVLTLTREIGQHYPSYTGLISGEGGLRIEGTVANYWRINNAGNSFSGGVTVVGYSIFQNDGSFGNNSTINLLAGGSLGLGGTMGVGKTVDLQGSASMGGGQWNGVVQGNGYQLNVNYKNLGLNNAANSQASTFNNQGTLRVGVPGSLGSGALSYTSNTDNHLVFFDPVGGTFSNSLAMSSGNNRTVTVENSAAAITWTGQITGTGDFLDKLGPGSFAATNWAAGNALYVSAGTFIFNDADTANMGNVIVRSGGRLAGDGELELASGNSLSVAGTLAPGQSPGILTVKGGPVTFDSTGALAIEVNGVATPGTDYDQLVIGSGSTVTIAAGADLALTFGAFTPALGDAVYIVDNDAGGAAISGTFEYLGNTLADDALVGVFNGMKWAITYDAIAGGALDGGYGIALYTIPEPASLVLVALGVLGLRRRRPAA